MPFQSKQEWLATQYVVVDPLSFYRFIFPLGSFERKGHQEDQKANGLALTIAPDKSGAMRGRHTVITDGLEQIEGLIKNDFVITAPIGYSGYSRKAENARWLYALTLDIDHVDKRGLINLMKLAEVGYIPQPTFLVNSGNGIHVYYCFDEPVPMYKPAQEELKKLKSALVDKLWNKETSTNSVFL